MKQLCECGEDWSLAGQVQQLLLPKTSPVCSWCCIGVRNRMAATLGGDFFDFIEMPDGCQVVLVGDVTGHGTHASVVMALIYGYLHRLALESSSPYTAVEQLNRFLQSFARRSAEYDHFFSATLFYGVIDPERLVMSYVNAGQVAPLVRRGDRILRLGSTTAPVGFFDAPEIEVQSFRFVRGDRLLLVTDGLIDAENSAGEPYGQARLERQLLEDGADHDVFLETLFTRHGEYRGPRPYVDDCTAIVLDFLQRSAAPET